MKIAFIGTHGVGKTTLCYDLAAALKRLDVAVDLVKEVARSCPLPINRETTDLAQRWILHTQIAWEIAHAAAFEAIICDRAVLDNYAYLVQAAGRQPDLDGLVGHWMKTYDLLVKVPVLAAPTFDGTRDTSVTFQVAIDRLIDRLLDDYGLPRLELPVGDRAVWIHRVLARLNLPRRPPQLGLFR